MLRLPVRGLRWIRIEEVVFQATSEGGHGDARHLTRLKCFGMADQAKGAPGRPFSMSLTVIETLYAGHKRPPRAIPTRPLSGVRRTRTHKPLRRRFQGRAG